MTETPERVIARQAFTFAFAAGFKCADETSRQCALAMDDAWNDYLAIQSEVPQSGHRIIAEADLAAVVEALKPFSDAVDKANARVAEAARLSMGTVSDNASVAFGVKIGHLRAARAALARIEAVS